MNKVLKYMAAAVFIIALAINVVVTLDDPFVMLSDEAIATTTSSSSGSASSFMFDNESWNNYETHILFTDWLPILGVCQGSNGGFTVQVAPTATITLGGVSATLNVFSVTWASGTYTWNGHMVQCNNGNGNCWDGTDCIIDQSN